MLGKAKSEIDVEVGNVKTLSKAEVDKLYGLARRLKVEDAKIHKLDTKEALAKISGRTKEED